MLSANNALSQFSRIMAVATTYAHLSFSTKCSAQTEAYGCCQSQPSAALLSFGPKLTLLHAIAMLLLRSLATYSAVAHIAILVSIPFHPFPAFHPFIRILSFFFCPLATNLFHTIMLPRSLVG
jgi:hypothetical protein